MLHDAAELLPRLRRGEEVVREFVQPVIVLRHVGPYISSTAPECQSQSDSYSQSISPCHGPSCTRRTLSVCLVDGHVWVGLAACPSAPASTQFMNMNSPPNPLPQKIPTCCACVSFRIQSHRPPSFWLGLASATQLATAPL
jgi:hypothetical protein